MHDTTDGNSNDQRFPDGLAVVTPYPVTDAEAQGDRASWPWLPATIQSQCGPDEWTLVIEAPAAITTADDGTGDDLYPIVSRPVRDQARGHAVTEWWQDQLSELRHHWGGQGGAYAVNYLPGCDLWIAQRADDGTTLRAGSADELRDLIVADYTARPVPRCPR